MQSVDPFGYKPQVMRQGSSLNQRDRHNPVSYTHLDVYKRQKVHRPFATILPSDNDKLFIGHTNAHLPHFIQAVSYTHLDVYKRQAFAMRGMTAPEIVFFRFMEIVSCST